MNQIFDRFNNPVKPQIILTKPTGEEIFEIGIYNSLKIDEKYNDVSQISFIVYDGEVEDFSEIKGKKHVTIDGYGEYIIDDVIESNDGFKASKAVLCKSIDFELSYKRISLEAGIYKLYDIFSPADTVLGRVIDLIPSWSIGSIDSAVASQYRYFDIDDKEILQLLYTDVENYFQCIFEPDYETRTINIIAIANVGEDTDIYLSLENLINSITISELSNEIVTDLYIYGGNGLNIRQINPTGNNSISNLDYFKTTEWMSQGLIDALDVYDILYASEQATYSSLLLQYKTKNAELLALYTELALLENELIAFETLQREQIQAGISISTINTLILAKQSEIASKESAITNKEAELDSIIDSLNVIVETLALSNNFTTQEIQDLDTLTITYTYQNEAFIVTDTMTEVEKQEQAELLLADGEEILARLSQPRFSFKIDLVDFLKVPEFSAFIEQFELASSIYIELEDGVVVESRVISYSHDWDNNSLSIEFTSRYRVSDPSYTYSELYGKSISAGISVSFSKYKYSDWQRNSKDEVTLFMESALDASLNNVVSSDLQEVITDKNGTRYRQSDGNGGYLPEQMWDTNNMRAFTDDGWNTAKMALGKIEFDGVDVFGLVNSRIVGGKIANN